MKRVMCLLVLSVVSTFSAHAGEVTIRETDSAIVVEYSPDEADRQATSLQEAERERNLAEKEKKEQIKRAIAERKAAGRSASEEENGNKVQND